MRRAVDFHDLEERIRAELSKDLSGVEILRVSVSDDVDMDDDDILRVVVIFDGNVRDISPGFLTGAIRRVQPVLSEQKLHSFPMMSFISDADAKIAARP